MLVVEFTDRREVSRSVNSCEAHALAVHSLNSGLI